MVQSTHVVFHDAHVISLAPTIYLVYSQISASLCKDYREIRNII